MRPQNTATSSPTPAEAPAAPRADSLQALVAWITEATAPVVGEDFFQALIKLLATRIGVDTALLTQCPTSDREVAETLAFWHRGEFEPNVEFRLAGTPCEQVIHDGRFCFLPEGVSQRFPDWAREEGGVESFIGVPVTCPETGKVLGHIAVYDRNPMPRDAAAETSIRPPRRAASDCRATRRPNRCFASSRCAPAPKSAADRQNGLEWNSNSWRNGACTSWPPYHAEPRSARWPRP